MVIFYWKHLYVIESALQLIKDYDSETIFAFCFQVSVPKSGPTVFCPLTELIELLSHEQRVRWECLHMISDRRSGPIHPLIYSHPLTKKKVRHTRLQFWDVEKKLACLHRNIHRLVCMCLIVLSDYTIGYRFDAILTTPCLGSTEHRYLGKFCLFQYPANTHSCWE